MTTRIRDACDLCEKENVLTRCPICLQWVCENCKEPEAACKVCEAVKDDVATAVSETDGR